MEKALQLAEKAFSLGEIPVGALIVFQDRVIGEGFNRVELDFDATAHAELIALKNASSNISNPNLKGAILYTTLEPCPMCLGALLLSNISSIVYGASNQKLGAVDTLIKMRQIPHPGEYPEVIEGVLTERCQELLNNFFTNLRRGG